MIVINGVVALASTPWTVNPNDYRYDMTVYLNVKIDSEQMDYSKYEVAAFYGNECRGIAEPLSLGNGKECLYLRIRSNVESGEAMTFKYYDKETEKVFSVPGVSIQFESNGLIGYPSSPYLIEISDTEYFELTLSAGSGGTVDQTSESYAEGTKLTITATPLEGYSFAQWSDGNTDNPRTLIINQDMTLEAEFKVNSYSLVYLVDGKPYKEYLVEYGSEITIEAEPEKEGYTFSGWDEVPEAMPAHDVTVNGTFSVNSYMAVFKIGDEVIKTKTIVYGNPVEAPEAPAKEGHTFAGWQEVPETMPAHDIEVIGSYTVNSYRLTYTLDGETYKESTVEYGSEVTAELEPEKEGYTFSGWEGIPETMPAHDVTISGSFSINSYNAVFRIGDEVIETKSITFGSLIETPEAPEKEGYTFTGWQNVPEAMPARDIAISGNYTLNSYKLVYTVDGDIYKEYTVDYGSEVVAEVNPEKEGYTFSGWQNIPETMPAHDVTVSGSFSVNSYNVVFKIDGDVIETKSIVFGQQVVAPEAPAKEGHTFAGWKDLPEAMPAHDIEIIGSYDINSYLLSIYIDDELISAEMIEYGSVIEIKDPEVPEGMMFDGWNTEIPEYMPAHDVDIYGCYSKTSGVSRVDFDDKMEVTVFDIKGNILYRNKIWRSVKDTLSDGIYIVNGVKHLIKN